MTAKSNAVRINSLLKRQVTFVDALTARVTIMRAIKVSAIVGTILIIINQGDLIAAGGFPPLWKIMLTYLVPYSVSSYSTAALLTDFVKAARKQCS